MVTRAQYLALQADDENVANDQAALATATSTDTADQAAFAAGLDGPKGFLSADGTSVDVVTPTPASPGYTVLKVPIVP